MGIEKRMPIGTRVEYVGHCQWAYGAICEVIGYRHHHTFPSLKVKVIDGIHPRWPFTRNGKPFPFFAPDLDEVRVIK
jgi:hypothetical protein